MYPNTKLVPNTIKNMLTLERNKIDNINMIFNRCHYNFLQNWFSLLFQLKSEFAKMKTCLILILWISVTLKLYVGKLLLNKSLTPLNSIAAKYCKAMDSCKYWTWLVDTVGKKCCLKTSDSGLTSLRWPGASGAKSNCCGEDKPEDC